MIQLVLPWRRLTAVACTLQLTALASCIEPGLDGDSQQSTVSGPSLADAERALAQDTRATAITTSLEGRGCTKSPDSAQIVDSIVPGAYLYEAGYSCNGAKLGARIHAFLGADGEVIHVSAARYDITSGGVTATLISEEDNVLRETVADENWRKQIDQQIGILWFIYLDDLYQHGLLDSLHDDTFTGKSRLAGARSAQDNGTCIECGMLDFGGSSCSTDCCSCFAAVDGCYHTQVSNAGGREAAMNAYSFSWAGTILVVTAATVTAVYGVVEVGTASASGFAAKELTTAIGEGLSLTSLTNWLSGSAWRAGSNVLQTVAPGPAARLTEWSQNSVIGASVKGISATLLKMGIGGLIMKYWNWLSIAMDMPIMYLNNWGPSGKQMLCNQRGYCPPPDCTDTGIITTGLGGPVGACCSANPRECPVKDGRGKPISRQSCPVPLKWDISYEKTGCLCPQGLACLNNGSCHFTCAQPAVEATCSEPPVCKGANFTNTAPVAMCM